MLTARQRQVMLFIQVFMKENGGVAPSFEQIRIGTGMKSSSGAHAVLKRLEERGYINRLKGKARAIEIVKRVRK